MNEFCDPTYLVIEDSRHPNAGSPILGFLWPSPENKVGGYQCQYMRQSEPPRDASEPDIWEKYGWIVSPNFSDLNYLPCPNCSGNMYAGNDYICIKCRSQVMVT